MLPSLKRLTTKSSHRARKAAVSQSKNEHRIEALQREIETLKERLDKMATPSDDKPDTEKGGQQ